MINQDLQLKLQAYLDGELADREAAEVRNLVARDAEAQALLAELTNTNAAFKVFEAECRVPESREFYWSKIQREIERQEQLETALPVPAQSWFAWLRGHFRPLSGVALACCILGIVTFRSGGQVAQTSQLELASDEMGAYTFRDHNERMTMVWIYDKGADSEFTDSAGLASVVTQ